MAAATRGATSKMKVVPAGPVFPYNILLTLDATGTIWADGLDNNDALIAGVLLQSADTNDDIAAPKKFVDMEIVPFSPDAGQLRILALSSAGKIWQRQVNDNGLIDGANVGSQSGWSVLTLL